MQDLLRDKTRDKLVQALNSAGVKASLSERKRDEEKIENSWFQRSLGIIDIPEGAVKWVNILKKDANKNSPPMWWVVFCIPDERHVPEYKAVDIKSIRKKSFPIFGKVVDVIWKGNDHGTGLVESLSYDEDVKQLAKKVGNLTIHSYTKEFQGWTIQVDKRVEPDSRDWESINKITKYILESPRMS